MKILVTDAAGRLHIKLNCILPETLLLKYNSADENSFTN